MEYILALGLLVSASSFIEHSTITEENVGLKVSMVKPIPVRDDSSENEVKWVLQAN